MDNNYNWTSEDYIQLFARILNISLDVHTFFVTGVSKPKLINTKTNTSCKIKVYLSLIKQELGNHCFKQFTAAEIHEKLSAKKRKIIYNQMIQAKVIKDCVSAITFDPIEYEEIFTKAHAEEWTNIEELVKSHKKVLSSLHDICSKEEYKSVLPGNMKDILTKLKSVETRPCKSKSYTYRATRSYNGIVVEAKCTHCSFFIKYDATTHFAIDRMRLETDYSSMCKTVNEQYDRISTIKDDAFKVGALLIEIRELFSGRMQQLLAKCNGQNTKRATKLLNSLTEIQYAYSRKNNSYSFFNQQCTSEKIQGHLEQIKQKIVEEIERRIKEISHDVEREKQFLKTLGNSNSMEIILQCIHAVDGYGRTTYTELLKGSKTQKMDEYGLNRSSYYGTLGQLTKKVIEEMIASLEKHRCIETYYGRYDRSNKYPKLRLTTTGINKLNEPTEHTEAEAMPLSFFETLHLCTPQEKAKRFKHMDISQYTEIQFMELLQFVLTQRSVYKDVIDEMIEALSKMPKKYISIIELNAELENGVVKQTLKTIIKSVKERNAAC